jgi:hypothetical protein
MFGKQRHPGRLALPVAIASVAIALAGTTLAPLRATAASTTGAAGSFSRDISPPTGFDGHAARSVSVDDTGHLHLLKAFGSVLLEEGYAGGTLAGQAKVRLTVGSTVIASFSIQTRHGTIYGSGSAALHSSGRYASFGGTLSVARGTGSYARAHGAGKLYGVIDRRTSALTVQTVGTLSY